MKKVKAKDLSPAMDDLFGEQAKSIDQSDDKTKPTGRIGTDESGKGDYFGPLVTAAVWVDEAIEEKLLGWGVRDSKKLSDKRATELATNIITQIPHALVVIGPEKYNNLYAKIRNLNRLLAWTHARAIENLLDEVACDTVIADKFGDEKLIINALLKKGREVKLIQKVRAESDLAVAAASIVARGEFLNRMDQLSRKIGTKLGKGASAAVDQIGLSILKNGGEEKLKTVAKWHFKNTTKIFARLNTGS